MPWRTEPEIDARRQRYVAERRAIVPDIERGVYPFKDVTLTRADVEWLLATHESGGFVGPIDWSDERHRERTGLDLRGALLQDQALRDLPLARLRAGLLPWARGSNRDEWYDATPQQREAAGAHLERVNLAYASLEGAVLSGAHLEGAVLRSAHLEGARLRAASLAGTNLNGAYFDIASNLKDVRLHSQEAGTVSLVDVRWHGVNIALVDWAPVTMLGDESTARQAKTPAGKRKDRATRLKEYVRAVRANKQLSVELRVQGVNEEADRFAFRAQRLQRQVLRREGHWLRWLGSVLLDALAGYGFRPLRSVLTYVLVVAGFAVAYAALGAAGGHTLSWNEALVVSLTAFHGRGFFATAFQPGDPQAALAAGEAVIGLLIEITFIATFTNRFFAR
jgi:uncharacterized protein YjbI with pentapeptide repeats